MVSLIRPKQWQLSLTAVCLFLGALLAIQFRAQQAIKLMHPNVRIEDMTRMLKDAEEERDKLKKELDMIRLKLGAGENSKAAAGLTPLIGPGIIIKLEDSKLKAKPGEDANLFLVHDEDILKITNELFAAGAEAISVNNQRMVGTTEIRCVGPTISINNTRIASPYEIIAIGDPDALESALKMRGGIVETLKFWGIRVNITKSTEAEVPGFSGSIIFKYARPKPEEK